MDEEIEKKKVTFRRRGGKEMSSFPSWENLAA